MNNFDQFIKESHANLTNVADGTEASKALQYLEDNRKFTRSTIDLHCIGYCPYATDIVDEIKYYGSMNLDEDNRPNYSYYIKGRIILPIYDEFGSIAGFATRSPTIKPGNSWWNTASPFKKGNHLYLLNLARKSIFESNKVYVVEGYADALTLYQNGLKNVIAIMGTALTIRKVALIARYCNNVCLCFDVGDSNEAGQEAQEKSIHILRRFGFCDSISVIDNLPKDIDPDEFVIKYGIEKFLEKEKVLTQKELFSISRKVKDRIKKNY